MTSAILEIEQDIAFPNFLPIYPIPTMAIKLMIDDMVEYTPIRLVLCRLYCR